jgi:phosphoribosyl-ATP pyrophosphohydrolase
MRIPDTDGPLKPALVYDPAGSLVGTGLSNEKGYRKSIERGEFWEIDGRSGRLLPSAATRGFKRIEDLATHYAVHAEAWQPQDPADQKEPAPSDGKAAVPGGTGRTADSASSSAGSSFLLELQELIYRRREEMPEGSYTTHLFEKGEEKIRKKTGEEAVELLLAATDREIISESADLIYHLMVLLTERDLSIGQVIAELQGRH